MPVPLIPPHGGELVNRIVPPTEVVELHSNAKSLPSIELDARELSDVELIATGAASPLRGFLGSKDYTSVLERMRLADGTVWPLPLTLAVTEVQRASLEVGQDVALRDGTGELRAVLRISDLFERDPLHEAQSVYRSTSPTHPGVAYLMSRPQWMVGGELRALPLPVDLPFAEYRLSPRAMREKIQSRGWRRIAGFQTRNPIHRAHEHVTKLALELVDGLVIHPLVGETSADDVPASVRFRVYEVLLKNYYPKHRTILAAFPAAMRYAGPREAVFHALVRKNYGMTHLIVGRDHAGVGSFYGPFEAQQLFDQFQAAELEVVPLKFEAAFFCRACGNLASTRTCPHESRHRLDLSGSKVREILRAGGDLPVEFTRPEIAEILREYYAPGSTLRARKASAVNTTIIEPRRGFILWLTGLSGAGKTTLARAIQARLKPKSKLEVLDGDEVRTHLSKGLGFSREDRDTNIRRIGFVARMLARNDVPVIAAAISPYAQARAEVREQAGQDGIPFIEVHVHAELNALVERDAKGLYKKALAGEIEHFTGVSDPYEEPKNPEVRVRTDLETIEESTAKILTALRLRGLVDESPASNYQGQTVALGRRFD